MTLEQKANELDSQSSKPIPMGKWLPWVEAALNNWDSPKENSSGKNWVFLSPRFRAAATLRGAAVERILDSKQGARPYKIAPTSLHPAHRALHAIGLCIASQKPTLVVVGIAALANGSFHEALNILALRQVPVCFLLLEEKLTKEAPVGQQFGGNIEALCAVYDLEYIQADADLAPYEALKALKEPCSSARLVHLSI